MRHLHVTLAAAFALLSATAYAADYPAPKQGRWTARDFKFHTGDVMPELKLAYTTTGSAKFYSKQLQELLQTAPQRAM
jgi:homoserine O-acetyltransferase